MRTLFRSVTVMLLLLGSAGAARAFDVEALAEAKRELQKAVNSGDYQPVLKVRGRFESLAATEPNSALHQYWVAVADWRAASSLMRPDRQDKKKGKQHCQAGIAAADRALALQPDFAEAIAVKLGLQGLSIAYGGMITGMTLGPRMETDVKKALELAPDNPRVVFSEAMNVLHKPAFVGGSAEKALASFRRAIELFESERVTDPTAPDWGRDDALIWAGRTAMKLKDYDAARGYFQRALDVNPDHGWARYVLLPAVEKALAEKPGERKTS